jgi:hypothetical protein
VYFNVLPEALVKFQQHHWHLQLQEEMRKAVDIEGEGKRWEWKLLNTRTLQDQHQQ